MIGEYLISINGHIITTAPAIPISEENCREVYKFGSVDAELPV